MVIWNNNYQNKDVIIPPKSEIESKYLESVKISVNMKTLFLVWYAKKPTNMHISMIVNIDYIIT